MAKLDLSRGLYDEIEEALDALNRETAEKSGTPVSGTPDSPGAALFLLLTDIEPDPDQPRKSFDGDEDGNNLDGLRDSILQHGVLQPIAVRRLDDGKYRIIAGERRWRASCAARDSGESCRRQGYDLTRIPAVVLDPTDDLDRLEMQLVENLARSDMPAIDTARALSRLRECVTPKPSMDELARRLGRSKGWVHQMLSLVSPESEAVAEALGMPVENIGRTDLSRMCGWNKDEEKRVVISAIRARLDAGEPLTRALVDEEEERFEQARRPLAVREPLAGSNPLAGGEPLADGDAMAGSHAPADGDVLAGSDAHVGEQKLQDNPMDQTGDQEMERELEEGRDYIVVYSPADLDGDDLDDGTYTEEDEWTGDEEDDDHEPLPEDAGADSDAENAQAAGQDQPANTLSDMVTVTLPRSLLERAFAKAGRDPEGTPLRRSKLLGDKETAAIVDVLSALVEI